MDRAEIMRRSEVAAAMAEGRQVQYRDTLVGDGWSDYKGGFASAGWFIDKLDWRIKPKPLECWVWVDEHNEVTDYISTSAEEPRTDMAYAGRHPGRWVRMREVDE